MLHQFPAIDVNLDHKREPGLEFDMHEAEVLVKIVKIVVLALAHNRTEFQQSVVLLHRLECLAAFHNGKDADEAVGNGVIFKDLKGSLFFWEFRRGQVNKRPAQGSGHFFGMGNNHGSNVAGIRRKVFQEDIEGRKEEFPPGKRKKLKDMPFNNHSVKKRKRALDFILVLF